MWDLEINGGCELVLKIKLNFRQKAIGAKCERSVFTLSSGGKMEPVSELKRNLKPYKLEFKYTT